MPTRGQWRVWFRWILQSGLLEKLPARCDLEGHGGGETPGELARRLMAAIQDPELDRRARIKVLAEAQGFRAWVEDQLKANRKFLLAERAAETMDRGWLERWAQAELERRGREAAGPAAPAVKPRWDPMWDNELDG